MVYQNLEMNDTYCTCILKSLRDDHGSAILPAVFELLFSLVLSISGFLLNYKFLKKLKLERKNKPLGRKGNIIEPIMRWFLVIQIIFWPSMLLLFSRLLGNLLGIVLGDTIAPYFCPFLVWSIILGRTIIAYNSVFVALIRYIYIVHERKANQWDVDIVARRFQIASLSTPILHIIIFSFTMRKPEGDAIMSNTNHCSQLESLLTNVSSKIISDPFAEVIAIICAVIMIIVYSNIIEIYLYLRIFQRIKRYLTYFSIIMETVFTNVIINIMCIPE